MKRTIGLALALTAAVAGGCKKKDKDAGAGAGTAAGTAAGTGTGTGAGTGTAAPAIDAAAAPATLPHYMDGLATPESVLYDAANDRYLVSNINGTPFAADDNGFISELSPDGQTKKLKFIDGAAADVTLNAPKGMAIVGGTLYVADISVVRQFDLATGAAKGEIKVDGAAFLNDVAATADGGVVVTDTSVDEKFASLGNDAIYKIGADGKVSTVIKDKALGGPNGVSVAADGTLWVVSFSSGEIAAVDAKGVKQPGQKLPKGQLDGIEALAGGDYLVSSWEGGAVYRGKPGGEWKPVAENLKAPADIGVDSKRGWLLIPLFTENMVHSAAIAP